MKIEILIFNGCPNSEPAEKLVRETVDELGVDANIEIVNVVDNDDAVAKRFLGSPSIRINGNDIEVEENDLVQIYIKAEATGYIRNFRIYYDKVGLADTVVNTD